MNLRDLAWFAVGPPWGGGTWINAGCEDPHGGSFVVDCEAFFTGGDRSQGEARLLAQHICRVHNEDLQARVKLAGVKTADGCRFEDLRARVKFCKVR